MGVCVCLTDGVCVGVCHTDVCVYGGVCVILMLCVYGYVSY